MEKMVLASNNAGKVKELKQLLADLPYQIAPQSDFNIDDAEETGLTFVENAILKARHAATLTGLPSIADDSGLEVDALNGAPGIYSARYAGTPSDSEANIDKLLIDLQDVPDAKRTARFQCVIVFLRHALDPTPLICQGTWEGQILHARRGSGGFGYDPVFYLPAQDCASAELSPDEKNTLSHRGQALQQLRSSLLI